MSKNKSSQQTEIGNFARNTYGDRYLPAINPHVFKNTNANNVFHSHFGGSIFRKNTFYLIAGTDSGLLYQYIKKQGVPKGSRYLFVECPQVLNVLTDVANSEELAITTEEKWLEQAKEMGANYFAAQDQLILNHSLAVTETHYQKYSPLWHKLKESFDAYVFDQKMILTNHFFMMCQISNLTENQSPAACLKNTFKGKTAVLLAGGPSLNELLPWVKQHRNKLLVIAVSRISESLLQAGIQPDICVTIDPQPINLCVSRDILKFQNGTLLVNKNHVSPNLLSSWGGKKIFLGPRYPWTSTLESENLPLIDGTTVTDSAFALAIEMGVSQIILGGADFCFSQKGYTHASGSLEHSIGPRLKVSDLMVETNSGVKANTLQAYQASAMSIDKQAQNAINIGCRTINPAPGAMHLPHVEHLPLESIQIEALEKPACDILSNCTPTTDSRQLAHIYKEVLSEVDRVLKEVKAIKELSNKALNYIQRLFAKENPQADMHNKGKIDQIEKQLNGKYTSTTQFIREFGVVRFLPILLLTDHQNAEEVEESYRIDYQAFVKTSEDLIEILQLARTRTLCRQEEEKKQPDIKRLIKQWKSDNQPGRAIKWAQQHTNCINQLSEAEQHLLKIFQNTFNETVEKIEYIYYPRIKQGGQLDCVADWSQELFLKQDKNELSRLLSALQGQHDQKPTGHFISLTQAYLLELHNKPEEAIEAYESIHEGTTQENALVRLFELYIKKQDFESALAVLEKISVINLTYTPMYADLLQATGNIDRAVEVYTDYLLENPDDLDTMIKLGKLFQQCGSVEGVVWTMGYILDKDPKNQTAQQILRETGLIEKIQPHS